MRHGPLAFADRQGAGIRTDDYSSRLIKVQSEVIRISILKNKSGLTKRT